MGREYLVFGEAMVLVKGGPFEELTELGLSEDEIVITPRLFHEDIYVDDFGNKVPVDVLTNGFEYHVKMTLIHFDNEVLGGCLARSQAALFAGSMGQVGTPMFAKASGIRLNIKTTNNAPWRFYQSYIDGNPFQIPLGTKRTAIELNWRCLPLSPAEFVALRGYVTEIVSEGSMIYDRILDEEPEDEDEE